MEWHAEVQKELCGGVQMECGEMQGYIGAEKHRIGVKGCQGAEIQVQGCTKRHRGHNGVD